MNEKGMMPMDIRLLLTSLEAIKRVCNYQKSNRILTRNLRSLPKRARKGRDTLVPIIWPGFPRNSVLRSIATCARSMGVHIPCIILVIVVGLKRTEKRNPISVPLRKADER